jgi:hypothetical protein
MGCGCGVLKISEGQKEEMFTAGVKEMMKLALVNGYIRAKDPETGLNVKAPGEPMKKARSFAEKMHEASAVAREKCEETVESGTDKVNELAEAGADAAAKAGGMLGGLLGKAAAGAADLAGKAANVAASGAGLLAEKVIKGAALAMDEAINAIDKPFADVGKDIFKAKEAEIVALYVELIKECRIPNAVSVARGNEPWGPAEYAACSQTRCVDTFHNCCKEKTLEGLRAIVQDEINKHFVTKAWDTVIEKFNECNAKLREYKALEGYLMDDIKLDINEYIIAEVDKQFLEMMQSVEKQIRPNSKQYSDKTDMPVTFHMLFSGTPGYNEFTYEDYVNFRQKPK